MITFQCPHCSATLSGPEDKLGKSGRCPKCREEIRFDEQSAQLPTLIKAPLRIKPASHSHRQLWISQGVLATVCFGGFLLSRTMTPEAHSFEPAPPQQIAEQPTNIRINSQGAFDILEVQMLKIVDSSGNTIGIFSALDTGEAGIVLQDRNETARYGLAITSAGEIMESYFDEAGKQRLQMGVNGSGNASLTLYDAAEKKRIIIATMNDSNTAGVLLYDPEENPKEVFITQ